MTNAAIPADLLRLRLGEPSLRRSLAAMVRRRVPREEVEDIAQTVLCDALAAPGVPAEPEDLRRFVAGIARHKVADFHRRSSRRAGREAPHEEDHEPVVEPPHEARALLGRVAKSVETSREKETLEWLVREHHGEQLAEIAAEVGLPAPAVRQRVSRLRRLLRARWAHALVLLCVAGSCGALASRATSRTEAIYADPIGDDAARAIGLAQGTWRVERVDSDPSSLAGIAPKLRIHVDGSRIIVTTPASASVRDVVRVVSRKGGTFELELRDASGDLTHATARLDEGGLLLTLHDGRLRGTAHLVRE